MLVTKVNGASRRSASNHHRSSPRGRAIERRESEAHPLRARRRSLAIALSLALAAPAPALVNGAFPDTGQILLPADRPATLVLGTNFGLVVSEDDGVTWRWLCEHDASVAGSLYQLAAPPSRRVFTLGQRVLAWSDDLGCTWGSQPRPEGLLVRDYFPDPTNELRVLMLSVRTGPSGIEQTLTESLDGGATLGQVLTTAPADGVMTTLEIARSDPRITYATLAATTAEGHTRILRSADAGASWELRDPAPLGPRDDLLIAAVDPADPQRLFFRVRSRGPDRLARSTDGGGTITLSLASAGSLTAFVRLADGTLLAGALEGGAGRLYRSIDGGGTFVPTAATIHPRALAERGGRLYAATDNQIDGFALAVSTDRGDTWQKVMSFSELRAATCAGLGAACASTCEMLATQAAIFPPTVCAAPPDAAIAAAAPASGCSCGLAHSRGPAAAPAAAGLLALALAAHRRGRRARLESARGGAKDQPVAPFRPASQGETRS